MKETEDFGGFREKGFGVVPQESLRAAQAVSPGKPEKAGKTS